MTPTEAAHIIEHGCDHPPRVGGWCLACDDAIAQHGLVDQRRADR